MKRLKKRPSLRHNSFYSQKGEYATHRVAEAIVGKSWFWSVLNVAWTAGPVTLIAIAIGHQLGFGEKASGAQMIYFMAYSTVVGIFAIFASIFREALYQPKIEQEQKNLLESIDYSFGLVLRSRDLILASLPVEERKIMASYYTLQTAGESVGVIREAVYDLTNSQDLAHAVERISILAEQGMYSLIEDTLESQTEEMEKAQERLQEIAPVTFDLLSRRMRGQSPSARSGRVRDEGFIQRTLDAADSGESSMMTLGDAYEVMSLVFELLNGRKIPRFTVRFSGEKTAAKRKKALDIATRQYRDALRHRKNAMRLLITDINTTHVTDYLPTPVGSGSQLTQALVSRLRDLPQQQLSRVRQPYLAICRMHKACVDSRSKLLLARSRFFEAHQKSGEQTSVAMEKSPLKRSGLYIEETFLRLNDAHKLALARILNENADQEYNSLSADELKETAMEMITALDEFVRISHPEIQIAVESSNALQLGYLKASFTPATKVGWAHRVIQSMHTNKKRASHRLAQTLRGFYGVRLSPELIEAFHESFGADPDYLRALQSKQSLVGPQPSSSIGEFESLPTWEKLQDT